MNSWFNWIWLEWEASLKFCSHEKLLRERYMKFLLYSAWKKPHILRNLYSQRHKQCRAIGYLKRWSWQECAGHKTGNNQ